MSVIKVMDSLLANKIAAGEVVEACSSVVKELVENSIDAHASSIRVDLIDAGCKCITVIDDGVGMDRDDAMTAFLRHATSKISNEDDLFHIETLGFRGEALASIASVSNITLETCKGDVGTCVNINGGIMGDVSSCEARRGTSISVRDLFYNTPARLKHMKSLYTELANITDYINKLALSRPDIRFVLTNNGNQILNTDGSDNLLKTIGAIYGVNVCKKMLDVSSENRDYMINGYISLPEVHRSNRNSMIIFVNGRIVRNANLNRVINDSYHSYKPDNRYPIVVLNILVDPSLVDVNIHPTKMDIKFSNMDDLCNLVSSMIKDRISGKNLIPEVMINDMKDDSKNIDIDTKKSDEGLKNKVSKPVLFQETIDFIKDTSDDIIVNPDLVSEDSVTYDITNEEKKDDTNILPLLYPVGLVHGTYIICQNELGMYLIDQHAAKERINYEIVLDKLANPCLDTIDLLFPLTLEFSNDEFIILKENFELLKNMGIGIEEFGYNSVIIKSHPTWLFKSREVDIIKKIIEMVIVREKDFSLSRFNDHLASTIACKMSIKANTNITLEEQENLINDLRRCNNPYNCPHGRPTVIFYSNYDLEKLFKRSGF